VIEEEITKPMVDEQYPYPRPAFRQQTITDVRNEVIDMLSYAVGNRDGRYKGAYLLGRIDALQEVLNILQRQT
jgi:hypothetical protein